MTGEISYGGDSNSLRESLRERFVNTCARECGFAALSAASIARRVEDGTLSYDEADLEVDSRVAKAVHCPGLQATAQDSHYSGEYCPVVSPPPESFIN